MKAQLSNEPLAKDGLPHIPESFNVLGHGSGHVWFDDLANLRQESKNLATYINDAFENK